MVSVDIDDGDRFPVTTVARSLTGGSGHCGWLLFVKRGWGLAPPISTRARTVMHSQGGWVACIWIVYTRQGSVEVLQVTGSLFLQILLCCLIVVYVCLCFEGKQTCCDSSLPGSLRQLVHSEGSIRCTVTVYISSGMMASGMDRGGRPRIDRSGSSFRNELQTSWNVPEKWSNWTHQSCQTCWI